MAGAVDDIDPRIRDLSSPLVSFIGCTDLVLRSHDHLYGHGDLGKRGARFGALGHAGEGGDEGRRVGGLDHVPHMAFDFGLSGWSVRREEPVNELIGDGAGSMARRCFRELGASGFGFG